MTRLRVGVGVGVRNFRFAGTKRRASEEGRKIRTFVAMRLNHVVASHEKAKTHNDGTGATLCLTQKNTLLRYQNTQIGDSTLLQTLKHVIERPRFVHALLCNHGQQRSSRQVLPRERSRPRHRPISGHYEYGCYHNHWDDQHLIHG
jgi:hypothetical protein